MNTSNELVKVIEQTGLEKPKVQLLLEKFNKSFNEASVIAQKAKTIVVTNVNQKNEMSAARSDRLLLKNIRVEVEKTRKELKEQSLREGKAIDGAANIIKALIIPVEEYLEKQERFAEIQEAERIQKRYEDRINKLQPYIEDLSLYQLKDMSDEAFEKLLLGSKTAFEAQKEAERKAEEDRIAKEKALQVEQERIRKENEQLIKEAQEREQKRIEEQRIEAEKLEKERKAREAIEAKLKAEKQAQLDREREAYELEQAKKRAKEEAKRKALLAPDKEKLVELAGVIDTIVLPAVKSKEAGAIVNEAQNRLSSISNYLREKSKTL